MSWLTRAFGIGGVSLGESSAPATPIVALVEGRPARIVGVAEAIGSLLTTPVAPQPCLGFRLLVERRGAGGPGEAWGAVLVLQDCQSFSVRDESGLAIVEKPVVLRVDVDVGGWAALPPEVYALLDEANISLGGRFRDYEFRFGMALLKPGDRVSVEGRATLQIDPTVPAPAPRSLPETWHFEDSNAWPVVVRDVDDPEP
jgi:hypothetical protein